MRVIQVIDSLNVGGAERVLVTMCNILKAQQVDVLVCVLTDKLGLLQCLESGIPVYRLNRKFKWNPWKLYQVHRLCSDFDIVHIHLRYNLRYIGLAKILFGGSYQLLLHDHYGDIEQDKSIPIGLSFFMKRSWYAGVHPVLTKWAIEQVGVQSQQAFVLANTILKSATAISPQLTGDLEKSPVRLVKVANFRPSKNQTFAIQLMAALLKKHPASLDLIGGVNDRNYYARIRNMIEQEHLMNQVTCQHEVADVQPVLHRYTMAIHTASMESGPLVLLEYMALGLPFIAYKTGQVADELQLYFPEFFMTTFDIDEWEVQVGKILKMDLPALQHRMMQHFDKYYAPEVYGKKCQDIYASILNTSGN
ncbi:MAG: glycosyltransferase [Cyclobacteriaceae bacterium]|nr:glycosyltransferase [Cyclobacteriaceae bacterium]